MIDKEVKADMRRVLCKLDFISAFDIMKEEMDIIMHEMSKNLEQSLYTGVPYGTEYKGIRDTAEEAEKKEKGQ